jgi:hypothetical protein
MKTSANVLAGNIKHPEDPDPGRSNATSCYNRGVDKHQVKVKARKRTAHTVLQLRVVELSSITASRSHGLSRRIRCVVMFSFCLPPCNLVRRSSDRKRTLCDPPQCVEGTPLLVKGLTWCGLRVHHRRWDSRCQLSASHNSHIYIPKISPL